MTHFPPRPARRLRSAALLLGLGPLALCSAFEWNGTAGADFATAASWTGAAPAAGSVNRGDLYVLNGDASPLAYTEAQGSTRFECADFKVGNSKCPGGTFLMTGGELTVTSLWTP